MNTGARLLVLISAEKEIMKLTRADKGAVYEFQHKFRNNPQSPGLRLKQLKGGEKLWSARVNAELRAVLLHISEHEYLLIDVKHRREVYDDLGRYAYRVNRVTGGLEVIDLGPVDEGVLGRMVPPEAAPLFAAYDDDVLVALGVAEPLLPHIRALNTEDELLALIDHAPQLTVDVLLALYDGKTVKQVREQVTEPVRAEDVIDPEDLAAAVIRPGTQATSDDEALQAMLGESFERWQVFLHPTQRKLVEKKTTGATRVSGGPGTGKTIVALHRVAHLAAALDPGDDSPILLTTFNRNFAADLRTRLLALGGQQLLRRVDVVNIDRLAMRVAREADGGAGRELVDEYRITEHWQSFLSELGVTRWSAEFLAAEWAQIILGQMLDSPADYFKARRPGRGRPLSREARGEVWQLAERFTSWLDGRGVWTWRQVAVRAARLEANRVAGTPPRHRYRHVVVDEAQDLSPAHWKMLHAMVPDGPDDMFLVGDTHQRIYDNHVMLSNLGINIRGRSHRLTLSYRTTRQILATALELLSGEVYDDLDGGKDTLAGYRSLLRGGKPTFRGASTWEQEKNLIAAQMQAWRDLPGGSVAICVPTRELAADLAARLQSDDVDVVEIGPDGPVRSDGVHIGTMHRFKGLEYMRMIIAGVSDGLVPHQVINSWRENDPKRYQRERQRYRSMLFVAATRARDELAVFWHGTPSPFLTHRLVR
ncbi:UvrD-helicase domain-containing protein [Micromonospora sp. 4G55]|uniref:UvrD-helicase domain-containing protein n=1 Tax=Micromonospora sp. 4G55 TaxID=2806102 RepID=UPI001A3DF0D5|nr:UvrD-helicase domain-containing protein [Micromonospora sp. 4G55]MBM0255495.1 UvrD-helicase domain-containing protein [Micromonospora sp. 4G55]